MITRHSLVFAIGSALATGWSLFAASLAVAGDAVAIGYNADGVWTAVTYYSSSTPKGGADYKDEKEAREAAVRDLQRRADEGLATTRIIASSDRTAHVAYARGKTGSGAELHAVAYAESKAAAEQQAFAQLERDGATRNRKTIYTYFSHGADKALPEVRRSPARR